VACRTWASSALTTILTGRVAPLLASCAAVAVLSGCAGSTSLDAVGNLLGSAGPDEGGTIVAGLKQALEVGTERAVARTSQRDGFLGNPGIRIGLPESLQKMAAGLRAVGFGKQVDELEVSMNRAAEQASGEAVDVFWQGIRQMSFADARAILAGGDTAATEYFERTTREPLRERFEPIVAERMRGVGLARLYGDLVARYDALPFAEKPSLDLEGYVTDGALDGLFKVLGEEERRIRRDPAARTTALLKEVFK
jgi:hypothetical protein